MAANFSIGRFSFIGAHPLRRTAPVSLLRTGWQGSMLGLLVSHVPILATILFFRICGGLPPAIERAGGPYPWTTCPRATTKPSIESGLSPSSRNCDGQGSSMARRIGTWFATIRVLGRASAAAGNAPIFSRSHACKPERGVGDTSQHAFGWSVFRFPGEGVTSRSNQFRPEIPAARRDRQAECRSLNGHARKHPGGARWA